MKSNKLIQLFLSILLLINGANAQSTDTTLRIKNNRERLSIDTDRNTYTNGEKVFFSARYMLNGHYSKQQLSNILYLELINDNYEAIVQKKFKITKNIASGMIEIPEDAYTGNYLLRAYTQFQRNLDQPNFCYQQISIINPDIYPKKSVMIQKKSILTLPEGGALYSGVSNNVGLFLNDSINQMIGSISLKDQDNNLINTIKPRKQGTYLVKWTPSDTTTYQLNLKYLNGDSLIKTILPTKKSKLKTSIKQNERKLKYHLYDKNQGLKEKTSYRVDVVTSDYRKIYQKSISSFNDSLTLTFENKNLEDGLLYFVLREKERGSIIRINSCFVHSQPDNKITIHTDRKQYKPRQNVKVDLRLKNTTADSLRATTTVIRKGTMNGEPSIPPYVFLNPNLMENTLNKKKALNQIDPLLLKAGLIRLDHTINNQQFYSFLHNLNKTKLNHIPEIRDVTINGIIRDRKTKEAIPGKKLFVSVLLKNQQFHVTKTNTKGEFILSLKDFTGLNDLYLCPVIYNEKNNTEILIREVFSSTTPDFPIGIFSPDSSYNRLIEEIITNHRIKEITGNKQKDTTSGLNPTTGFSFLNPISVTKLEDYIDFKYMNNVFNEIVPHVYVKKTKGKYWFKIERENGQPLPGEPLVLLDNIPVLDINKIMEIHPSQIESIGVIPESYIIGEHTLNGVIIINSKTDNFAGIKFPPGSTFLQYLGHSEQEKFQRKTYKSEIERQTTIPDFRTTLYWNPDRILTKENSSFDFFTSDRKGKYEIIVRGYSKDGKYYSARKIITID